MSYPNPNLSPSGATFAQLQAGGLSSLLERLITVNGAAEPNPTVAATLSSNAGGTAGGVTAGGRLLRQFHRDERHRRDNRLGRVRTGHRRRRRPPRQVRQPSLYRGSGGTLPCGCLLRQVHLRRQQLERRGGPRRIDGRHGVYIHTDDGGHSRRSRSTTAASELGLGSQPLSDGRRRRDPAMRSWRFTGITGTTYQITTAPSASTIVAAVDEHDLDQHSENHRISAASDRKRRTEHLPLAPGRRIGFRVALRDGRDGVDIHVCDGRSGKQLRRQAATIQHDGIHVQGRERNTDQLRHVQHPSAERGNLQGVYTTTPRSRLTGGSEATR